MPVPTSWQFLTLTTTHTSTLPATTVPTASIATTTFPAPARTNPGCGI